MARLIVNPCTPQAQQIVLKQGVNRLGRREGNDFTIDDPSVSGAHCEVILADGTLRLRDLGSTNGSFVNATKVTETDLQTGQYFQLGNVPILFEGNVETAPIATPRAQLTPIPPPPLVPASATPTSAPLRVNVPGASPLRVSLASAHAPPPPSAEVVEEAPPDEEEPAGIVLPPNTKCKFHSHAFAHFVCTGCRRPLCDLCVSARTTPSGHQTFCRSCGALATPARVAIEAPQEKTFFRELPRAFAYPFRGKGVMILIFATIAFALLDFISRGFFFIITKAIAIGYFFSYAQNIINSTAIDEDEPPDLPGLDDVFGGFLRLLGVTLVSFGPALVLAFFAVFQQQPAAGIALIPAVIFGCLYFPMAFLTVAINDDVMSCNPLVVVPSILKVPIEYIITVILVAGVFGIRWLGSAVSSGLVGPSLFTTSMSTMFLLFGLRAVWALISVYLLTVTMRILGVLYVTKKHKLGW